MQPVSPSGREMDCSCSSRLCLLRSLSTSSSPSPTSLYHFRTLLCRYRQRLPSNFHLSTKPLSSFAAMAALGGRSSSRKQPTAWDEKPFEVLPGGRVSYFDEQDIVSFLDPPKELVPIDPASYNPAAYLWKKIGDIPEERRHRLLYVLEARLIPRLWQLVGMRYEDDKLAKKSSSNLLSMGNTPMPLELWNCRTSSGPMSITWLNGFRKGIFRANDGATYGRIILGASIVARIANSFCPLYFKVREVNEVMSTEQPCDLAYEFGDGHFDLSDYPNVFPKPAKHPWPFDDYLVIYIRHAGPGVIVGQAWQEGKELEQVPKKFCGEILMVKDYSSSEGT